MRQLPQQGFCRYSSLSTTWSFWYRPASKIWMSANRLIPSPNWRFVYNLSVQKPEGRYFPERITTRSWNSWTTFPDRLTTPRVHSKFYDLSSTKFTISMHSILVKLFILFLSLQIRSMNASMNRDSQWTCPQLLATRMPQISLLVNRPFTYPEMCYDEKSTIILV